MFCFLLCYWSLQLQPILNYLFIFLKKANEEYSFVMKIELLRKLIEIE